MSPTNKTKILIIEDDPGIREGLQELLEDEGFLTVTAINGQEALKYLSTQLPSIILLDLMMPIMDGFTFLEAFRKLLPDAVEKVPVIILTAAGERANLAQGVKAVLPKPIDIEQLLEMLNTLSPNPAS
jgi:CheY-like chemotaxis protein